MWVLRGLAGLSVLTLAACGGSEPRGQLVMTPRPELTSPPGDMAVRLLIIVSQLSMPEAAAQASAAAGTSADAPPMAAAMRKQMGPKWGTIGVFDGGTGVVISADFRKAKPGTYRLRLLDAPTCTGLIGTGEDDDKPEFIDAIDSTPLRLPQISIEEPGEIKREFIASGALTSDFKNRAVVLFDGERPAACGTAIASPSLPPNLPAGIKPPGGGSPTGGGGGPPGGGR